MREPREQGIARGDLACPFDPRGCLRRAELGESERERQGGDLVARLERKGTTSAPRGVLRVARGELRRGAPSEGSGADLVVALRKRREKRHGSLEPTGAELGARGEEHELRRVREAPERGRETRVRFHDAAEPYECLHETRDGVRIVRSDLDEALILDERFLHVAAREQEPREVRPRRREPGIDGERVVVVRGRAVGAPLPLREHAERVVRLRDVGVQPSCALEQHARSTEVAALELDQPEVHERVHEARAVLEGHAEARVRRFQVPALEGLDAGAVQPGCRGWKGGPGRAADEEPSHSKKAHGSPIGALPAQVSWFLWEIGRNPGCAGRVHVVSRAPMVSEADDDSTDIKPRKRSSGARPKKSKRPKPPIPQTEPEIDAPDRLTLFALGFMGLVTLVLWGFARGACNYHPPRETRRPRAVKIEELAREPKDAAMEMQERVLHFDFDGAAQLASGEALEAVNKAKAACDADKAKCAMERKNREKHVLSTPALLERQALTAVVRVTSDVLGKKEVNLLTVERSGSIWKVTKRLPDDPNFQARPMDFSMPVPGAPGMPVEAGSAAPLGSGIAIPAPSGSGATRKLLIKPPTATATPAAPAPAASH